MSLEHHQPVITKNTPVTIGLVFLVVSVSAGAIFKAGQVLTEFEYLKSGFTEIRTDLIDIKRAVQRIDTQKRGEGEYATQQASAQ